ncbi:hypothetical protein F4679DRAFT_563608 [Xylaria curta]|nr:hypothetical protein F4679DRAFT_563608 [Xylaria curta]
MPAWVHESKEPFTRLLRGTPIRGKDLDQVQQQFRGELQPRTRYLWLWFACAVLRQSWKQQDPRNAPSSLLGKGMWGNRGPYLRQDFILDLMEEIGHENDFLMDDAKPADASEDDVPGKALVDLVNQEIIVRGEQEEDECDVEVIEIVEGDSETEEWV